MPPLQNFKMAQTALILTGLNISAIINGYMMGDDGFSAPSAIEQPLSSLDTNSILIACQYLGETPDLANPSEQVWALAQHWRRMFYEALRATPGEDGSAPKSVKELMDDADEAIRAAVAANDNSLERLIKDSLLREQEKRDFINPGSRRRMRKLGSSVLKTEAT